MTAPAPVPMPFLPSAANPRAPNWMETILSVLVAGAFQPLVAKNIITGAQDQALASAAVALLCVVWAWMVANPSKQSPLAILLELVRRSGQGAAYNAAVSEAGGQVLTAVEAVADQAIHQKAGILAGPVDDAANAVLRQGVLTAETSLKIS